jgi:hypothetical protein
MHAPSLQHNDSTSLQFIFCNMAAKLAKAKISLYYDDVTCLVESFGFSEEAQ